MTTASFVARRGASVATMSTPKFTRLVRFVPVDGSARSPMIGEPVQTHQDVGLATYQSEPVEVSTFSGSSVLSPGQPTGQIHRVKHLLSPLAASEVGTIRCIGLNYKTHAKEVNMDLPTVPILFFKPCTTLADPYPAPTILPRSFIQDEAADFESEVAIVIGKDCKNVSEDDALDYLLGITASNDVSSRKAQFEQSQWCYSKSFDGACPLGPALVSPSQIEQLGKVAIEGVLNGETVQKSNLDDLIFSIPKLISFLSQGTTMPAGTVVLTGTPGGIGWSRSPRKLLSDGSEFRVHVSHGVGTLINKIENEK